MLNFSSLGFCETLKIELKTPDMFKQLSCKTSGSGLHFGVSSVQCSARQYLSAEESPYALQPLSQKFPQCCLWNSSNVGLIDDWREHAIENSMCFAFSNYSRIPSSCCGSDRQNYYFLSFLLLSNINLCHKERVRHGYFNVFVSSRILLWNSSRSLPSL